MYLKIWYLKHLSFFFFGKLYKPLFFKALKKGFIGNRLSMCARFIVMYLNGLTELHRTV